MSLELAKKPLALADGLTKWKKGLHEEGTLQDIVPRYIKGTADVAVWQRQRIVCCIFDGQAIQLAGQGAFEEEQVLEVRIFNEKEELHLWRRGSAYEGRYVADGEGDSQSHVDCLARLWGHTTACDGTFATLTDKERFLELTVPCHEKADYYGLVTRNYIEADEKTGQAGYCDYRFVRIEAAEGGE